MLAAFQKASWNWMPVAIIRHPELHRASDADAERGIRLDMDPTSFKNKVDVANTASELMRDESGEWADIPLSSDDDERLSPRGILEFRKISECESEHTQEQNSPINSESVAVADSTKYHDGQPLLAAQMRSGRRASDSNSSVFSVRSECESEVAVTVDMDFGGNQNAMEEDGRKGSRCEADGELTALRKRCGALIARCDKHKKLALHFQQLNAESEAKTELARNEAEKARIESDRKLELAAEQLKALREKAAFDGESQKRLAENLQEKNRLCVDLESQICKMKENLRSKEDSKASEGTLKRSDAAKATQTVAEDAAHVHQLKARLADTVSALAVTKKQVDFLRKRLRESTEGMREQAQSMRDSSKALSHALDISKDYKTQLREAIESKAVIENSLVQMKEGVAEIRAEVEARNSIIKTKDADLKQLHNAVQHAVRRTCSDVKNSELDAVEGLRVLETQIQHMQSKLVLEAMVHRIELQELQKKTGADQQRVAGECERLNYVVKSQEAALKTSSESNRKLKIALQEGGRELERITSSVESLSKIVDDKNGEIEAKAERIDDLERQLVDLNEAQAASEATLRSGVIASSADDLVKLEAEDTKLEREIDDLRKQLDLPSLNVAKQDKGVTCRMDNNSASGDSAYWKQKATSDHSEQPQRDEVEVTDLKSENERLRRAIIDNQHELNREEWHRYQLQERLRQMDWTRRHHESVLRHLRAENAYYRRQVDASSSVPEKERKPSISSFSVSSHEGSCHSGVSLDHRFERTSSDSETFDAESDYRRERRDSQCSQLQTILETEESSGKSTGSKVPSSEELPQETANSVVKEDHLTTASEPEGGTRSTSTSTPLKESQATLAPNTAVVRPFLSPVDCDANSSKRVEVTPECAATGSNFSQDAADSKTQVANALQPSGVPLGWNRMIKFEPRSEIAENEPETPSNRNRVRKKRRSSSRVGESSTTYPIWRQDSPQNDLRIQRRISAESSDGNTGSDADCAFLPKNAAKRGRPRSHFKKQAFQRPRLGIPMSNEQFEHLLVCADTTTEMPEPASDDFRRLGPGEGIWNDDGYSSSAVSTSHPKAHEDLRLPSLRRSSNSSSNNDANVTTSAIRTADSGLDATSLHGDNAQLSPAARRCYFTYKGATIDAATFDITQLRQMAWQHGFAYSPEEMAGFVDFLAEKARELNRDPKWRGRHSLGKPSDWAEVRDLLQ